MRAGYSKVEITPGWQLELAGYGYYLHRALQGVHDPLWARALAMESNGRASLLISCDLVGLGEPLVARIKKELSSSTGIPEDAVMLCCTHTHSGPATAFLRGCGQVDPRYVDWLYPQILQSGLDAFSQMSGVESISWHESPVEGVGFNRVYGDAGPVDPNVRTLMIRRADTRPVMIVNYACHPVANGRNDMVSADFPGCAMRTIEEHGIDCLYLSGFCGDIDPLGPRDYQVIEAHGATIAGAALEGIFSAELLPGNELRSGVKHVRLAYDVPSAPELLDELRTARDGLESDPHDIVSVVNVSWVTDALAETAKPEFNPTVDTCIQAIALDEVVLLGFPGEVFTALGLEIRRRNPQVKLMTVNTANDAVGYIPTADEFARRGYASHAAARIYGTFTFLKGFGESMMEDADVLIKQMR